MDRRAGGSAGVWMVGATIEEGTLCLSRHHLLEVPSFFLSFLLSFVHPILLSPRLVYIFALFCVLRFLVLSVSRCHF